MNIFYNKFVLFTIFLISISLGLIIHYETNLNFEKDFSFGLKKWYFFILLEFWINKVKLNY